MLMWMSDGDMLLVILLAGQMILVLDVESHSELARVFVGSDLRGLVFVRG